MTDKDYSGEFDVVVVGGALVGGVLALSLANSGYRVALLDAQSLSVPIGYSAPVSLRTTAIAAGSVAILNAVVPQLNIVSMGSPIQRVHVSQQGFFGATRISATEEGVAALGYVADNLQMQQALLSALASEDLVTLLAPVSVQSIAQDSASVTVNTDSGVISAPLLIGVDGTQSVVRKFCNIPLTTTDYEQCAVVSSVEAEKVHRQTAYERFTPQGPMAMLPLGTHTLSLIFTIDADQADAVMADSDDAFLQRVQQTFGYRLGRLSSPGARQVFPLRLQESARQSHERILLLGNAARSLHPVAGQGFNLAVRDIGKLLEIINSDATDQRTAIWLSSFCAQREWDQQTTARLTDFFARTFRGYNPILSHLRGLGLIGLDVLPMARRRFARRAMGLSVSLPDIPYRS